MIERLKAKFGVNKPIFTNEILDEMSDLSRPRVFQLLSKAEKEETIIRFDKGVYYLPTETRYGKSLISVEQVVIKKYISDKDQVYGIFAGLQMQLDFLLSYQVPTTIEIITNNESMRVREVRMNNRSILLRRARVPITASNADAYTLLELFTNMDMQRYCTDSSVRREVRTFVREKKLVAKDVFALAGAFPARTIKKLVESEIIYEFA